MATKPQINKFSLLIRILMNESGISESELARQTGLPQTTINRLLLGGTSDPRAHTLKPIADFFGVTIGQLCGFEPLSPYRISGSINTIHQSAWRFIPIIHWDTIKSWEFNRKTVTPLTHKEWISTERLLSENAFAVHSLSFMEPRFRKNSVLIVDPKANYKDGHYVVIALDGINPTVRRILIDGSDILLQAFEQTQSFVKLTDKQTIYGTIIESRVDTYVK